MVACSQDWTRASVHGAIIILPAIGSTYPFPKPDEEEIIVLGMLPFIRYRVILSILFSLLKSG
jgi:hypothetical protein